MKQPECVKHDARTYQEEIALVLQLISEGDRAHALHHCIGALGLAPDRSEWQPPLRELLREPALLNKLEKDGFFGAQAARAFHLHEGGLLTEAIALAAQIHGAVPHLGFHHWVSAWGREAQRAGQAVAAAPLIRVLLSATSFGIGRIRMLPAEQAAAAELIPVVELALELFPDDSQVAMLASSVLRRAGHAAAAVAAAERMREPGERRHTIRGLALRAQGEYSAALAEFEAAFAATGDEVHLMEMFRVLADAGRWQEALAVLARRSAAAQEELERMLEVARVRCAAAENAPPPQVPPLDVVRRRELGHGVLWPMHDATANMLRDVGANADLRRKGPQGAGAAIRAGKLTMQVSGREGNSNRLCLALMLKGEPDPRLVDYERTEEGLPDAQPGRPRVLWQREGQVMVQALPPPPEPVLDWIEQLALRESDGAVEETEFESTSDFLNLSEAAAATGVPAATAEQWLAATIYPRMPLIRVCTGPDWVLRWQVAALIGLLHSESGWMGTARRRVLLELLQAESDWPLAAAIRVAAEIALHEPASTHELRQCLIELIPQMQSEPNSGLWNTLLTALEMLPQVPAQYRDRLRAKIDGVQSEAPTEEPPAPPAERKRRPWWKFWGPS